MWIQKVPGGGVLDVAFAPDGRTLYTVDTSASLIAWDIATHVSQRVARDERLESSYTRIVPLPDGQRIVALTYPFAIWDVAKGREIAGRRPPDTLDRTGAVVHPNGRIFGVTNNRKEIAVWNLTTKKSEPSRRTPENAEPARRASPRRIGSFDVAPDGETVVVALEWGWVLVCQWGDGPELSKPVVGPGVGRNPAVRFAPDGRTLAVASDFTDPSVTFWDVKKRRWCSESIACRLDQRFVFNPVAPVFGAVNAEGLFTLYRLETGEVIRSLDFALGRHVSCACFSPDGLTCALGGTNKQFAVFDVDV